MERPKGQLAARLVALMQLMSSHVRPAPPEEWSDIELTMTQWRTLALLHRGPRRMSEIAAYLGSSLSSATSMIDRLVNKQLVARMQDPADAFGQAIGRVFGPIYLTKRHLPAAEDAAPKYSLRIEDRHWHWVYLPVARLTEFLSEKVAWLQRGRISTYLLYSFLTLIGLLVFVR